jgi:hypothetical protein
VETGLNYNYMRDYDAQTGRYVESDPIGLKGGINTYVYVSDPLTQVDPFGLMGRGGGSGGASTSTCDYYAKKCAETGCRYYCFTGPIACKYADINPLFLLNGPGKLNCVRKCLVEEDDKVHRRRQQQPVCYGNKCLGNDEIDGYHRKCFTSCGATGYPGISPPWLPLDLNPPH